MASRQFAKRIKRSALTIALGFCFAGTVSAQSAVGSINGETTSGATVRIENVDTGLARELTADATGRFTFPQLAPGRYKVISGGQTRDVQVKVGTGSTVTFGAQELGAVDVVGASSFNPIDVSSVESTTVFTAEQIDALPVARDVTNVALLAPGTVRGDSGLGNLASFGGASVAENGYYINGFDVTNIRNFVSFADLPFDAIGEQQVKTGGYGAEYGRSLGGVISIVTKRGTNDWTGGASVYWAPEWAQEHGKDVITRDPRPEAAGNLLAYRSDNESDELLYNVYGGGPLIKDKLFFFGLIQGQDRTSDTFFDVNSQHESHTDPSGMVKLDWNLTDNHVFELTGIWNEDTNEVTAYENLPGQRYTGQHATPTANYTIENGGEVWIGKYTGYLTDNFTIAAQYGYLRNTNNFQSELPGRDCPAIYDSRDANLTLLPIGCWNSSQFTIRDPAFGGGPDEDRRRAWRIDAEWQLGDHKLRFGFDNEKYESTHAGDIYSGGEYFRYFRSADVFGVDFGDVVRRRTTFAQSGSFEVVNQAAYLEDSWQLNDKLMIYAGLRGETFENKNADGVTFIESDTLWAPRVGFSWDVNGDSTFKVFGNAGRYYIPVASNTNIRGSSWEYSDETWYLLDGVNPDGTPQLGDVVIDTAVNGSFVAPDPRTVAATNLDPMYQDEYILGMQMQLDPNWSLGIRAIHRDVKAGMDDACTHNGFDQWARDNGIVPVVSDPDGLGFSQDGLGIDMPTCYIINPGKDVTIALDPTNSGTLQEYTVPAAYLGLPEYQRTYNAVEFFWERAKADNWYLQGSYTFAKSKGNVEGYVNSTLEQDDAGATQDFDFGAFEDGAYGYLPNDRRHTLKLFGSYDITDEWSVSGNLLIQSGRPVNCNGFVPIGQEALDIGEPDAGSIGNYSGSSFYCIDPNGPLRVENENDPATPADNTFTNYRLTNRGEFGRTPWSKTIDLGVTYQPNWLEGLTLQMKVFNVLNSGTVTEYNEASQANSASSFRDPDFLNDFNYQEPRYVRFTARYEF